MEYVTAGESHGPKLTAIVSGVPSGIPIDIKRINSDLSRRQAGYGRGDRQKIERDTAQVTGGVRFGKTTGAPVSIDVQNRDWANWEVRMAPFGNVPEDYQREVTPRPGHADLVGVLRNNNTDDCRNILERSSARETAARVAACGVAKEFLAELDVEVMSYVTSIGSAVMTSSSYAEAADFEPVQVEFSETRCPAEQATEAMKREIDAAKDAGESLGGTFRVGAKGLVPGLGSYASGRERLTSQLAAAVYSIPAIKGVEFGIGFEAAVLKGSQVHDPIVLEGSHFTRTSNNAGGLEGGIPVVIPPSRPPALLDVRVKRDPSSTMGS